MQNEDESRRETDSECLRFQVQIVTDTCIQADVGPAEGVSCLWAGAVGLAVSPGQRLFIFSASRSADQEPGLLTDPILTEPEGLQGSDSRHGADWRSWVAFRDE